MLFISAFCRPCRTRAPQPVIARPRCARAARPTSSYRFHQRSANTHALIGCWAVLRRQSTSTMGIDMTYTLPALPPAPTTPRAAYRRANSGNSLHPAPQTYINNLNAAVEGTEFAGWPVEKLVSSVQTLPEKLARCRGQPRRRACEPLSLPGRSKYLQGEANPGALGKAIDEQPWLSTASRTRLPRRH